MKDELLPSTPLLHYTDIFHHSIIPIQSCENSFYDVTTLNHSQNTWNGSFSFKCGEDKCFLPDPPNLSYYLFENIEGEISHSPLSPLYDSLDHEDTYVHNFELSNRGCHDTFIDSFDHESNSSTVNISMVFDDPFF